MIKLNEEDTKRTEELRLIVWAHVAKCSLSQDEKPDEIADLGIESHRGMIGKAIRLLGKHVTPLGKRKKTNISYDQTCMHYQINLMEDSMPLGKAPVFLESIAEMHDEIFGQHFSDQFSVDTPAYKNISDLSKSEVLYVYWHQDEYEILQHEYGTKLYPKALLDTRMKATMRAIVEQYFHSNFHTKIEQYLNAVPGSIKHDDHFKLQIRNFAAHGFRFTADSYFGTNGFVEEYTHYRDYFEALLKNLTIFEGIIQKAGGFAAITETYRKDTIEHLLHNAPLCAFQPHIEGEEFKDVNDIAKLDMKFNNPFFNSFILRNSQYLDYDLLYKDDQAILFIDKENLCHDSHSFGHKVQADVPYTPNQDEIDLIHGKD